MDKINCAEDKCVHHGDGNHCNAYQILVRNDDGNASCDTFEFTHVEENTAQERMTGYGNGYIGDGMPTMDYFRVEFAKSYDSANELAEADINCTASECKHNKRLVCKARAVSIGAKNSKNYCNTKCETFDLP